jgi:hypothetical protein
VSRARERLAAPSVEDESRASSTKILITKSPFKTFFREENYNSTRAERAQGGSPTVREGVKGNAELGMRNDEWKASCI